MATVKEEAIDMIQKLPDTVTLQNILESLIFRLEVETSIKEIDSGNFRTQKEVENRLAKWLT